MRNGRFRIHLFSKTTSLSCYGKHYIARGWGIRRIISPFAPVESAIIVKRYYCITHRRETSFASLSEHFSFTPKFVYKVRKQYRIVRACLCAAFCLLRVFAETVSERIFEIGFSQSGFYTF